MEGTAPKTTTKATGRGNILTAFARMDRVWQGSGDIAVNKAYTARAFDM